MMMADPVSTTIEGRRKKQAAASFLLPDPVYAGRGGSRSKNNGLEFMLDDAEGEIGAFPEHMELDHDEIEGGSSEDEEGKAFLAGDADDGVPDNRKKRPTKDKHRRKPTLQRAPGAPKRFKSPYICYSIEMRDAIKKQLAPDAKMTDIMKKIAESWRQLDDEQKEEWQEKAQRDRERYDTEMAYYSGPLKVPKKRKTRHPEAPKRAMSAFLHFSKLMRPQIKSQHQDLNNADISKLLAERWKNSTDEEKSPFFEKERTERAYYKKQMAEWNAQQAKLEREAEAREPKPFLSGVLSTIPRPLKLPPDGSISTTGSIADLKKSSLHHSAAAAPAVQGSGAGPSLCSTPSGHGSTVSILPGRSSTEEDASVAPDYMTGAQESFQVYDAFTSSLASTWGGKQPATSGSSSDGSGANSEGNSPPWIETQDAGGKRWVIKQESGAQRAPLFAVGPCISPLGTSRFDSCSQWDPPPPPQQQKRHHEHQQHHFARGQPQRSRSGQSYMTDSAKRLHHSAQPSFALGASSSGSSEAGSAAAASRPHHSSSHDEQHSSQWSQLHRALAHPPIFSRESSPLLQPEPPHHSFVGAYQSYLSSQPRQTGQPGGMHTSRARVHSMGPPPPHPARGSAPMSVSYGAYGLPVSPTMPYTRDLCMRAPLPSAAFDAMADLPPQPPMLSSAHPSSECNTVNNTVIETGYAVGCNDNGSEAASMPEAGCGKASFAGSSAHEGDAGQALQDLMDNDDLLDYFMTGPFDGGGSGGPGDPGGGRDAGDGW